MGHFGFTGEIHILHFIREFGLILFVFCIGLQVGPSFFSSFKKGGMTLNMLAVGIVALNIVVALGIYFIDGNIDLPMMVGILYGAVTNTPGLGAAQEALNQLNYTGDPIASGICLRLPARCSRHHRFYHRRALYLPHQPSPKKKKRNSIRRKRTPSTCRICMHLEVRNEAIDGKKLIQVKDFLGRPFRMLAVSVTKVTSAFRTSDTEFHIGDQLFIVCSEEDAEAVTAFIGKGDSGGLGEAGHCRWSHAVFW